MVELLRGPDEPEVPFLDEVEGDTPRLRYFLAMETTSRKFASTSLSLQRLSPRAIPLASLISSACEEPHPPYLRKVHPDGVAGGDGVGDLDRRSLVVLDGRGRGRLPRGLGSLALYERDLLLLERGVELLDLCRREVPLLYEVGDLLRTDKALASPPIQSSSVRSVSIMEFSAAIYLLSSTVPSLQCCAYVSRT